MTSPEPTAPRPDCFWWEAAPPRSPDPRPVAESADVVIVGAGYTGLSAALTLARAGRSVQVFDSQRPGEGASSRNGGITSGNLRLSLAQMTRRFGAERAQAMLREGKSAREDLYRFIEEERIDCDFGLVGRFVGAVAPGEYDTLARDAEALASTLGIEAYAVPRQEMGEVLDTDFYHGGNIRMDIGGLHPAKLHAEMLRLVLETGTPVHGATPALSIASRPDGYHVRTAQGEVKARAVVVCTNGYTDAMDPWLRRRIVPVRSRIVATAELPAEVMNRLMPRRMMCSDTRKLSYYFRPSPDGRRILFGGRDGTTAGDPGWPTAHLRRQLTAIFPELEDVALTHSWYGYVGMNRDMVPRIFDHAGIRYSTGYCGSGVVWARWAGQNVAHQLLGSPATPSAFDFRPPPAIPLFRGKAWFMSAFFAWFGLQDKWKMRAARSGRVR